jgi:hypothetical protein
LPENRVLMYYGREEAASPATGAHKVHELEQEELVSHALELPPAAPQGTPPEDKNGGSSVPVVAPATGSQMAPRQGTPVSD